MKNAVAFSGLIALASAAPFRPLGGVDPVPERSEAPSSQASLEPWAGPSPTVSAGPAAISQWGGPTAGSQWSSPAPVSQWGNPAASSESSAYFGGQGTRRPFIPGQQSSLLSVYSRTWGQPDGMPTSLADAGPSDQPWNPDSLPTTAPLVGTYGGSPTSDFAFGPTSDDFLPSSAAWGSSPSDISGASPSDIGSSPSGMDISPTGFGSSPSGVESFPAGSPTGLGSSPSAVESFPAGSPTDLGSSPTDVGSSPTDVGSSPTDVGSSPSGVGSAPSETSDLSAPSATGYSSGNSSGSSSYTQYNGDGSAADHWPAMSSWVSTFDQMWDLQQSILSESCGAFGVKDNSASENAALKSAIQSVSKQNNVDPRFTLAIVMQESKGCVRVYNTTSPGAGVSNPGLMQDHSGAHSCNTGVKDTSSGQISKGTISDPCPSDQITGMISDGVGGTLYLGQQKGGDGLKQTLSQAATSFNAKDAQQYYIAARIYNAGSYVDNDLGAPGATRCYCSDVANRLTGWNGATTGCTLD